MIHVFHKSTKTAVGNCSAFDNFEHLLLGIILCDKEETTKARVKCNLMLFALVFVKITCSEVIKCSDFLLQFYEYTLPKII